MVKIVFGRIFIKSAKKLPKNNQIKLSALISKMSENPFHSYLHTKPLAGELVGFYSFRISRDWRVIFKFNDADEIKLIQVGHRKDIYKKIN